MKRFAKPYADVLLEAARAEKQEDTLLAELSAFSALLAGSDELRRAMESPAVGPADRDKALSDVAAKAGYSELGKRAILLLGRNWRLGKIDDIVDAYRETLDRSRAIAHVEVRSAEPLDAARSQQLEAALVRLAGRPIRMTVDTDPSLLAGMVAKIGSTVYDASLKGEIQKMRRLLAGSGQAA